MLEGDYILNDVEDISYAFNEEVKVDEWDKWKSIIL